MSNTLTEIDSAGWLCFGEGIGDHQIAFVDINIELLIGKIRQHIAQRPHQQIQMHLGGSVRNYVKEFEQRFIK